MDMSCVTQKNTLATLSFGVPYMKGGGLIFGEIKSNAYISFISFKPLPSNSPKPHVSKKLYSGTI
jgi:hypothetical protein